MIPLNIPTISSVYNWNYITPIIPINEFNNHALVPNINTDSNLRKKVTDYIYNKIYNYWLNNDFNKLYSYINIDNNKTKDKTEDKTEDKNKNEKILKHNYIMSNILNKKYIYKLLIKFVKLNKINWWDIKIYKEKLKKFIYKNTHKSLINHSE